MGRFVGRNVTRKDGAAKAAGTARYVDDLTRPGLLHARTIRSSIACGEISRIHLGFDTSGFTIVDATDIPGRNVVALLADDQPCLADGRVNHVAEPILLLGARGSRAVARGGRRHRVTGPARRSSTRPGRLTSSKRSRSRRATWTRGSAARTWSSRASTAPATRSTSTSSRTACSPSPRTAASRWWARCSAPTTCIARSPCCSG